MKNMIVRLIIRLFGLFSLGLAIYGGMLFYNSLGAMLRHPFVGCLWLAGILAFLLSAIGLLLLRNFGRRLFIGSIVLVGPYTAFVIFAFSAEGNNPTPPRILASALVLLTGIAIGFLNMKSVKVVFRKKETVQPPA